MAKKEYVSMRGKVVDIELLKKMNELVPAVGNAKVNARGDELGPGGKIIRKREDIIKDYYQNNPNQVVQESSKRSEKSETVVSTQPAVTLPTDMSTEEKKMFDEEDWIEDDTGNFVKKDKPSKKPKAE
jgi:hypothetical protein